MDDIKDTIAAVLKDLETRKERTAAADPAQHFGQIFSKRELTHLQLAYFRKGILAITVDSATWLYHLSLRKQELLRKLAALSTDVKDVRFVIGEIKVAKTAERGTIKFL
jgi:hypothetical protein